MPELLQKFFLPIKARWDSLTREQKIRLVAAVGIILLALFLTIFITTRTTYERFVSNIDAREIRAIETTLNNAGIKNKLGDNGTAIYVDRKRVPEATIEVDANPATSGIAFTYENALSLSSMSTTESQKRGLEIRAKQYELQTHLESLNGIGKALVELSMPNAQRFINADRNVSSASVILNLERPFSRSEGESIARHVSRAVEGLLIENVVVMDQYVNVLYSGGMENEDDGIGTIAAQREKENRSLTNNVKSMFMMFGEVTVTPNLVYPDVLESIEQTIEYKNPLAGSDEGFPADYYEESSQFEGTTPGDEPGLQPNDLTTPDYQTGGETGASGSSRIREIGGFYYDQVETMTRSAPGGSYLRDISSIAVSLVKYRPYSQRIWMGQDSSRRQADWETFKETTSYHQSVEDPNLEQYVSLIATGSGIDPARVYVSIFEVPVFLEDMPAPIELNQIIMFALAALLILMLALGLIRRKQQQEMEEEPEPELSVEELLVNTQLEEAREEAEKLDEINYNVESEVKKQIEKFVTEKPEAVAALLRNWINNEEW